MQRPGPTPDTATPASNDLRKLVQALLRRRWLILGMAALTVAVALGWSLTRPKVYRSTATVEVKQMSSSLGASNQKNLNMSTQALLVKTPVVAELAAESLGEADYGKLLPRVSATVQKGTSLLNISCSHRNPERAKVCAQAFAQAYLDNREAEQEQEIQKRTDGYRAEQALALEGKERAEEELETAKGSRADWLQSEISKYDALYWSLDADIDRIQLSNIGSAGRITNPANLPSRPASPKPLRDAALALGIGLALGIAVALIRERLDNRIHDREQLEKATNAPVLGVVTSIDYPGKEGEPELATRIDPRGHAAEAYRTLRTNLQFMASVSDMRILAVTSTTAGEGKTTTSANLAVAIAQSGRSVLVVSADLRKPSLHRYFHLENRAGLTEVIAGQATLDETVIDVAGTPSLHVLTSGANPPNPAELLGSERMLRILEEAADTYDFVILDTPPVLAVSDPLVLANRCQGTLLVVEANGTTEDGLRHSVEQLTQIGAKVVGTVLNKYDPSQARYRGYYYRYAYEYRYVEDVAKMAPANGNGNGTGANGNGANGNGKVGVNGNGRPAATPSPAPQAAAPQPVAAHPSTPQPAASEADVEPVVAGTNGNAAATNGSVVSEMDAATASGQDATDTPEVAETTATGAETTATSTNGTTNGNGTNGSRVDRSRFRAGGGDSGRRSRRRQPKPEPSDEEIWR